MNAVVLVGGEGTRMRPLTQTIPKPLLPLVNRPFLSEVLDRLPHAAGREGAVGAAPRLAERGVAGGVLRPPYLEPTSRPFIDSRAGSVPRITWTTEPEPLDTAGA